MYLIAFFREKGIVNAVSNEMDLCKMSLLIINAIVINKSPTVLKYYINAYDYVFFKIFLFRNVSFGFGGKRLMFMPTLFRTYAKLKSFRTISLQKASFTRIVIPYALLYLIMKSTCRPYTGIRPFALFIIPVRSNRS